MTCLTCGAALESTDTLCPVCSAPVDTDTSATDAGTTETSAASASSASDAGASGNVGPSVGSASADGPPQLPPGVGGTGSGSTGWPPPPLSTHPSGLPSEVRGWGIASHLVGLGGALLTAVTLGFLGPLFIWLVKRDDHPFVEHHAKESLNFQLTTLLALVVGLLAAIPVFLVGILTLGVLWIVALIIVVAATVVWFVFPIIGAVRAANGEGYRYPISIRFVR